jgi:hypothetical protein
VTISGLSAPPAPVDSARPTVRLCPAGAGRFAPAHRAPLPRRHRSMAAGVILPNRPNRPVDQVAIWRSSFTVKGLSLLRQRTMTARLTWRGARNVGTDGDRQGMCDSVSATSNQNRSANRMWSICGLSPDCYDDSFDVGPATTPLTSPFARAGDGIEPAFSAWEASEGPYRDQGNFEKIQVKQKIGSSLLRPVMPHSSLGVARRAAN